METKFLKAQCKKSKKYFGITVSKFGGVWKVINVDELDDDKAKMVTSEVRQPVFETNENLLACYKCGSRKIGGCNCATKMVKDCSSTGAKYNFQCAYCKSFEIDYTLPRRSDIGAMAGKTFTVQGKEVKVVTFSNVEWTKFDNIKNHTNGRLNGYPFEPIEHVIANKKNIEFHGYNISAMDEGVFYVIPANDDFIIECNVDTSTIQPHPGGELYINFGLITAKITQNGGDFMIDGKTVGSVGSKFKMRLSLTEGGKYEVFVDNKKLGEKCVQNSGETKITFGFAHGGHHCHILSHAYLKDIEMQQAVDQG